MSSLIRPAVSSARSAFSCWMLRILFVSFLLAPGAMYGQVVVTANSPTYNFQVLPGSMRQISVSVANGSTNRINWSVLSSTGGASATFTTPSGAGVSSVANALPTVQVNIGATAGSCSIPQAHSAIGTYSVGSTATVTVQAQSVDDTSSTATFLFNVCAKTTTVLVAPAYQQAFRSQHRTLQSWVSGDTDETGTWSIVTQAPGGGDGVLADTGNRDTDFSATVPGRYVIQYTSHSDSSKSATAIVYVSPNSMPSYSSTPNKTEPRECYADPDLAGPVYEVGAGKTYATLSSLPAPSLFAAGTMVRVWNTDTTGTNPSTFHEYYQLRSNGTATQPLILCGVPDASGNLPIIDGDSATGSSDASTDSLSFGVVSAVPTNRGGSYYQLGSVGPSYISITGLHIKNGYPDLTFQTPTGITQNWNKGAACIRLESGAYQDISGNDLDSCGNGFFSVANQALAWARITQLLTLTGNHIHYSGVVGDEREHQSYIQTFFALIQGNLVDDYRPLALGGNLKWRGVEGIFRYNRLGPGGGRSFDLVENQDAYGYTTFEGYLGVPGETNCAKAIYCINILGGSSTVRDEAGADGIAGLQESSLKDFIYGNEILGEQTVYQIHYGMDQSEGSMASRNGVLYYFSNTLDSAQVVFDTGYGKSFLSPQVDARNNIIWSNSFTYDKYADLILRATTNLMKSGTFSITTPINGGDYFGGSAHGWWNRCDASCRWQLALPFETHLYGLSSANYLSTSSTPYDQITMVPPSGSAAIGAATVSTDILATMPVRWQYDAQSYHLTPRLYPLTIGAVDQITGTQQVMTPSVDVKSGTYTTVKTVHLTCDTPSSTIYYTTDGSTPTTASSVYTSALTISTNTTLKAFATATGMTNSVVRTANYTIALPAGAPVYSSSTGYYSSAFTVTITSSTPGATIYYTTDGSTPTTSSAIYSGGVTISATTTLKAIATASGFSQSAATTAVYTIGPAAPTFSPAGGSYSTMQTVTLSSATAGATIYYTTDGTTPTTSSAVYSSPITVFTGETINAISFVSGYVLSPSSTASYLITSAAPRYVQQCSGAQGFNTSVSCTLTGVGAGNAVMIGLYSNSASAPSSVVSSSGTVISVNSLGAAYVYMLANASSGNLTFTATYPSNAKLWMTVSEFANVDASPLDGSVTGTCGGYCPVLDSPSFSTTGASDLLWEFCQANGGGFSATTTPVTWNSIPFTPSTTVSGATIGALYGLTPGAASYRGECAGSGSVSRVLAVALKAAPFPPAATPAFSPAGGTFSTTQNVSISTTTPLATIYYTTDGSTPTTASTVYTGAISVPVTTTLKAIATAPSFTTSLVGTATYTINPNPPGYVQECHQYQNFSTTITCTLTGVAAGDAVIVGLYSNGNALSSLTASSGTPTLVTSNGDLLAYVVPNTSSGSLTITATYPVSGKIWMTVSEYSNVGASPVDTSASGTCGGYCTTLNTSNLTTGTDLELLWSFCEGAGGSTVNAGTAPITWNSLSAPSGTGGVFAVEYGATGSAGTYYGQCTGISLQKIVTVALKRY